MNEEILKLAKSVRHNMTGDGYLFDEYGIETFYRAAFNSGLEEAAKQADNYGPPEYASDLAAAIRALKQEQS